MDLLTVATQQLLLFVHLMAFAFAIVAVLREDLALLKARSIDPARLSITGRAIAWMLALLWGSGLALAVLAHGFDLAAMLHQPKLAAKLTVVCLLTVNGLLLHWIAFPMLTAPRTSTRLAATVCAVLGAFSTVTWLWAAFIGAARLLATMMSYGEFLAMYGIAVALSLIVSLAFVRHRVERLMTLSPRGGPSVM